MLSCSFFSSQIIVLTARALSRRVELAGVLSLLCYLTGNPADTTVRPVE